MSIRVTLCFLFVVALSIYAYRDWFKSLCGALFLLAFLQHPDMPRSIAGIPGLNLWNVLMINVLIAWKTQRSREGLQWDATPGLKMAFLFYLLVIVIAFLRALINPTHYLQASTLQIVVDTLVNPLKFLLPGFLLFDGCRSRHRVIWGLTMVVLLYFVLAVQVVRYMGFNPDISGSELTGRAAKIIQKNVGYSRVDMSMILAGGSWAVFAFSRLVERKLYRRLMWGAAFFILLAQALTGGRMGYITWGMVGLILCLVKWRRMLPLVPFACMAVVMLMPGVRDRILLGFVNESGPIVQHDDGDEITSGRNTIWPYVVAKIEASPIVGYGRMAMIRTGLSDFATYELNDGFAHPHNAYFELLLDNGLIGAFCVMPFFCLILWRSAALFVDRTERFCEVAGGVALALVLALLFAAFGAQTFYPREGVVGMWAAVGVAMRVSLERARQRYAMEGVSVESLDAGEGYRRPDWTQPASS